MNTDNVMGTPDALRSKTRLAVRSGVAALAAFAMMVSVAPTVRADDLTDQRKQIRTELAQTRANIDTFSAEAQKAAAALQKSRTELAEARTTLANAQATRAAAQREDARLAKALVEARAALAKAKQKVKTNKAALDAEAKQIGASVRDAHQQNTQLLGLAAFTTTLTTGDVNSRTQWSETIFTTSQAQMDRLNALHLKLQEAQKAATAAEKSVETKRQAAADQLVVTQAAEAAATTAQSEVTRLVAANSAAQKAADAKLAGEKNRQAAQAREDAQGGRRIQARIAAQKAAAARKAAAERARRIAAEKARRAAAARAAAEAARARRAAAEARARRAADAAQKAEAARRAERRAAAARRAADSSSSNSQSSVRSTNTGSHGLLYPMPGSVITSPYGMRFHPIWRTWRMHDGVDFAAPCGTPMIAPADGVVTERYYSNGYGNRLMIDLGTVRGSNITVGFNHAERYIVRVGQRVSRGQVIGYEGTTGWSTGCHLHFMVWKNGVVSNPMSVY